jgi:hypothetical protein
MPSRAITGNPFAAASRVGAWTMSGYQALSTWAALVALMTREFGLNRN